MDKKMYILINENIKIGKGKMSGQVGHAVCSYMYENLIKNIPSQEILDEFEEYMIVQKKIILKCSQSKLEELEEEGYIAIRDRGLTQLEPNTLTCVNLGILEKDEVPEWVKVLKLVS